MKPTNPRAAFPCEFCHEYKLYSDESTVCKACDDKLEAEQSLCQSLKEAQWAIDHQCRNCKRGLPLDRYFTCYYCEPLESRPSEGEYDAICDMDIDRRQAHTASRRAQFRSHTEPKVCAGKHGCGKTLSRVDFLPRYKNADGLHTICKTCFYLLRKNKKQQKEAASEVSSL